MKYIGYTLAGLLALVVLGLAVLLVPAHLQIRGMDVAIPSHGEITSLIVPDIDRPQLVSFVNTAQQTSPLGTIGHPGILITWINGKQLLIDTGMDREAAIAFGKPIESVLGADPTETFGPIEEHLGDDANDINGIVFTHLHSDHTQGVTSLCNAMSIPATIYQTREQASEHNSLTRGGQDWIENASCEKATLGDSVIKPIEGFPGVFAIAAGGHTPGSTVFVVLTSEQTWIFSGDITNDMASINNNAGKGWMYSYLLVPEDTALLESWRIWLKAADELENVSVIPAHDINHMRGKLPEL